jgi:hypothetical protein
MPPTKMIFLKQPDGSVNVAVHRKAPAPRQKSAPKASTRPLETPEFVDLGPSPAAQRTGAPPGFFLSSQGAENTGGAGGASAGSIGNGGSNGGSNGGRGGGDRASQGQSLGRQLQGNEELEMRNMHR